MLLEPMHLLVEVVLIKLIVMKQEGTLCAHLQKLDL